jgi:hypothetical protein
MNFKIFMRSVLGAVVLCLLFIWLQDILSGEEGRVRKFILRGKQAVETKDFFACADIISASYRDKYGNSRETLLYATKEFFGYYKEIFVNIESMEIKFDGAKTKASVEIVALVIGKTQQNNAEKILEGNKGRFRIKLIKEEKKWYLLELEFFEPITVMGQNIS